MTSYRRRLEQDLEGWIGKGLVPAGSRDAILESVPEARRLDSATVLAVVGALLAGVAVIAFVAANWAEIPRILRFGLILSAFLATAGGAAWAPGRGRAVTAQALLAVSALVFAAAIGLTGQTFDIAGDPQTALRGAGLAAVLLALAGRSPWTAAVAVALFLLGDFTDRARFDREPLSWLILVAPLAAALAMRWRSHALAHAAGLATLLAALTLDRTLRVHGEILALSTAVVLAGGAAAARYLRDRYEGPAGVLYGWLAWGALIWLGASGFGDDLKTPLHSVAWMAVSVGAILLGRRDSHVMATAAGVVSLFASSAALLFNLGVGLLTSAMVFGGLACVALVVAFVIKRRAR